MIIHKLYISNINCIILPATIFGSFYLFSTSLIGLNKKWLKNEKFSLIEFINVPILIVSGTVITTTIYKAFKKIC